MLKDVPTSNNYIIEDCHEMRNMDDIIIISCKENNHEEINKLEKIQILKAVTSLKILNDLTNGKNNLLYKYYSQLSASFQQDKPNEWQKHF